MIRFLITIPRDLHGELKETAAQRGQTLTGLIRGILWDWISQHSGKHQILKEVDEMSDKQQKVVANIAKIAGNLPDDARERILVFAQGVSAGASLRDDRKGEENNGEKTK